MNTNHTTRFAGLLVAMLMSAVVNGAMLWQFDAVARQGMSGVSGETSSMADQRMLPTAVPRPS